MGNATVVVVKPGEAPTIQGPAGGPLEFKLRGAQTADALTALENVIAPGDGPPLHTHANEDEAWFVIDGQLRFLIDGQLDDAPTGTFVFVPRGTPHTFQNIGEHPARLLVLFTPSGMEAFFDAFAAQEVGTDAPAAFAAAGAPAGMQVVGPPLGVSHPR